MEMKKQESARRSLGPGENPRDALNWLQRELKEIDRLISSELERVRSKSG